MFPKVDKVLPIFDRFARAGGHARIPPSACVPRPMGKEVGVRFLNSECSARVRRCALGTWAAYLGCVLPCDARQAGALAIAALS